MLGEKAVKAAHETTLPESVLADIDGARKYAENRVVMDVGKDLAAIVLGEKYELPTGGDED